MTYLQEFENWLREQDRTENTIKRYSVVAAQFIQWFNMNVQSSFTPSQIEKEDVIKWRNYLLKEKKSDGQKYKIRTVINKIESLKTFFRFLQEMGHIEKNPLLDIKLPKYNLKAELTPKWLEENEFKALENYLNDFNRRKNKKWAYLRDRALCYTMLHAGLRVSEAAQLELNDIFLKSIHVRDSKGYKSRDIPMNSDLKFVLNAWLEERSNSSYENDFVFVSKKRTPLTVQGIEYIVRQIKEELEIENLTPHRLRHTFCKRLYDKTKDIDYVARLAGHSDLETTRIYITPSNVEQEHAVEQLASGHFREGEDYGKEEKKK